MNGFTKHILIFIIALLFIVPISTVVFADEEGTPAEDESWKEELDNYVIFKVNDDIDYEYGGGSPSGVNAYKYIEQVEFGVYESGNFEYVNIYNASGIIQNSNNPDDYKEFILNIDNSYKLEPNAPNNSFYAQKFTNNIYPVEGIAGKYLVVKKEDFNKLVYRVHVDELNFDDEEWSYGKNSFVYYTKDEFKNQDFIVLSNLGLSGTSNYVENTATDEKDWKITWKENLFSEKISFKRYFEINTSEESVEEKIDHLDSDTWGLQWTITDLNLSIGDFINNLITNALGQKVTLQAIIFNKVDSLDANFFSASTKGTTMHQTIKKQINYWYSTFSQTAIIFYLTTLLFVGVKVVLSETTISKATMNDVLIVWFSGLLILFLFNYVMKSAFEINESLVKMLAAEFDVKGSVSGSYIGDVDEFTASPLEFRSPEYRSKYTGILDYGSKELNEEYLRRLTDYRSTADIMRIMRAYAGVSHRLIYCIIWLILLFQLIIFLAKYYKRYFVLAVLIVTFPLISIAFLVDKLRGREGELFRRWCEEFFINVFIQSVHAVIYSIIAAVCIDRVTKDLINGSALNWIIIIVAIDFLAKGEKIARKILRADRSVSMRSVSETSKAGKEGANKVKGNFGRIAGMFRAKGFGKK